MTDKGREQTAQDVQEYTESQKAALIAAAAKTTGKPAAALTVEDAEAVLFEEIGVTVPATPMQAARRILIKNIEAEQLKAALREPAARAFHAETGHLCQRIPGNAGRHSAGGKRHAGNTTNQYSR